MARVADLYLEMFTPRPKLAEKSDRIRPQSLCKSHPNNQPQRLLLALPENPRVSFSYPFFLSPSVSHSTKTLSGISKCYENCLGKFPENPIMVVFQKCGSSGAIIWDSWDHSIENIEGFREEIPEKFVFTMRGSPLSQEFWKMPFHSILEFQEIQGEVFVKWKVKVA